MANINSDFQASDLPFLLYRLSEPSYYPKGDNRSRIIYFQVSPQFLVSITVYLHYYYYYFFIKVVYSFLLFGRRNFIRQSLSRVFLLLFQPSIYRDKATQILNNVDPGDNETRDISSYLDEDLLNINLDEVEVVKKQDQLNLFVPRHSRAAGRLIEIFMRELII